MQNVTKDPNYFKSTAKFFGVEEEPRNKRTTYAERLKTFIGS